MMNPDERRRILAQGRTAILWEGEPMLGGVYGEEEIEAAVSAIRTAMKPSVGFGGPLIGAFEAAFAEYVGVKHAIALNSAGPGLDMAMRWLGLQPGDEVIVPAVNFVASPLAVVGAGGRIVWAEVDPATLQLDPDDVARRITPRTRAIFPVHMNGLAAPLNELHALAERHPHPVHGPLAVIEDAARACGGRYQGRPLGSRSLMTVFSFHTMKNMCTLGEGGMITTNDDAVNQFCRGTRFYGLESGIWGSSNVMTTVQAAVGMVQLKKLDDFVAARRRLAAERDKLLEGAPRLTLPAETPDAEHTYYLYTCLVDKAWAGEKRDRLIRMLDELHGIRCIVANRPCYETHALLRDSTLGQRLPVSESLGQRLFCLPIHPAMSDADNRYLCAALLECMESLENAPDPFKPFSPESSG